MAEVKEYTKEEVAKHNTETDCWLIIENHVYDISKFLKFHPGGQYVVMEYAGKDATKVFYEQHRADVLRKYDRFRIGKIAGAKVFQPYPDAGEISKVPYAESSVLQGFKSVYYNASHHEFRAATRKFLETEILPAAPALEESGNDPPLDLWAKMGKFGYLAARIGPGEHLKVAPSLPAGVKPEKFDYFHELIAHEEFARFGYPGFSDGLGAGMVIGLPPLIHFGPAALKQRVVPEVLLGQKRIALAISEAFAGSDVAGIRTTAKKTPDGKHYIVNGTKKWITGGHPAEYFVTAVRTGKPGMGGISLLLVERGAGLNTDKIKTSYSSAAGTCFIRMENVMVPVENLLGKENRGFECIMYNFNHERWLIIAQVVRATRMIIEESQKWAMQREVFGKKLIEQPVIRNKLALMVSELESVHNWMENITYQMCEMTYEEQSKHLAGPIALCKLQSTRVAYAVSDHAVQIFGGRGITRTGMGYKIEAFQRSLKFGSVLGGSEEIMADLGIKQAMRYYPKRAKL